MTRMGGQPLKVLKQQTSRQDQKGKEKRSKQLKIRVQWFHLLTAGKKSEDTKTCDEVD